jgi:uncharacterized damage-inducible protein DinB
MLIKVLSELYERDLLKLKQEIEQYSDEADLWKTSDGISNSAGNLSLHLTGNLQHFFGATLGGTGYVRDRDGEFANKNISREQILTDIDTTRNVVRSTLAKLTESDLAKNYPLDVAGQTVTTEYFIVHLASHFNYHLGQINYHRRMLS